MKQQKGEERVVYQSLAMIMQFGLNMIVPICMMSALGIWLDRRLGTSFLTIVLFLVGAVAGGQNIYRMAKRMYGGNGRTAEGKGAARGQDASPAAGEENGNDGNDRTLEKSK